MADAQSNIKVSIDTTDALASIKNLQRQISAFHTSMAKSGAAANAVTAQMQQNLINSVNATGKFSAQMKTIKTTTESFTSSLEKNKFSLGEYFKYAGGASKSFGKLFKTEFDTINKVARENVKDLQTQYIKMGRDANGAMKAIAVRPLTLDMNDLATKTMIASEKQALLNQLLKQGSTNLLNFGKNTQWAGRQLMVGFTIPLMAVGSAAAKTFMDMETQAIRFKKVYGDLFTPAEETRAALEGITDLGKEFTKYGIAVSSTVGLAAEAAAAGFKGLDLQRQTAAATKLSILGQVESQKALETTISLQNAFAMSSEDLAMNIDFLNAVENQTVLSLDDVATAIPKAAPIVQQLGGDVKDLAFFMTAMKEGGINASEGANALKSGLASLINPTGKAAAMLESFGINAKKIVVDNKGDLKKTVIEFATALNQLDPLNRAQAIEQMFGKFQFSRLSTLFANVTKEGTQASRVLDLAGSSVQELASLSEKELGMTSESAMNKFKASVENLKLALVPVGEEFLKAVTPIAEVVTKILEKFNNLGDGTKKVIVMLTGIVAGLGPVLLMTFGLLMNGLANIIKGFTFMKSIFNKTGQASATLGTEVKYMNLEQRNAAAVAASLDQVHKNLAQTFTSEAGAVNSLTAAYRRAIAAQAAFMPTSIPMARGPIKKRAKGKPSTVGGTGNKDSELAYLMPGETVIPTDMSKKYGGLINGMIDDSIPGYEEGVPSPFTFKGKEFPVAQRSIPAIEKIIREAQSLSGAVSNIDDVIFKALEGMSTDIEGKAKITAGKLKKSLAPVVDLSKSTKAAQGTFAGNAGAVMAHGLPKVTLSPEQIKAMEEASPGTSFGTNLAKRQNAPVTGLSNMVFPMPAAFNQKRMTGAEGAQWIGQNRSRFTSDIAAQAGLDKNDPDLLRFGTEVGKSLKSAAHRGVAVSEADFEKIIGDTLEKEIFAVGKNTSAAVKAAFADAKKVSTVMYKTVSETGREMYPRVSVPADIRGTNVSGVDLAAGSSYKNRQVSGETHTAADKFTMKAVRARVRRFFGGMPKEVDAELKQVLDINSPSKVTKQIGAETGAGYISGAKESIDDAKKVGQQLGSSVVSGASQSGRKNRRSGRAQGPAPIGPAMPMGAIQLGLIGLTDEEKKNIKKQRDKEKQKAKRSSLMKTAGSKMTGVGGGMGLLGANMALGMSPDFAGKGQIQSAMTGANLGMMFGPWGMAAGASVGLVTSAFTALIAKQKEHASVTKATFSVSNELITAFGDKVLDTSPRVVALQTNTKNLTDQTGRLNAETQKYVDLIKSMPKDSITGIFVENLRGAETFKGMTGMLRENVATQIALGNLSVENAPKMVMAYLESIGKANQFNSVWKSVSASLSTTTAATATAFIKLQKQLGTTGMRVNYVGKQIKSDKNAYREYGSKIEKIGENFYTLFNIISNGSLSFKEVKVRLDGLNEAGYSSADVMGYLSLAIAKNGSPDQIARFNSLIGVIQGLGGAAKFTAGQIAGIYSMSMGGQDITKTALAFANKTGLKQAGGQSYENFQVVAVQKYLESPEYKAIVDAQKKAQDAFEKANNVNQYVPLDDTKTGGDKISASAKKYLEILNKEIKALEDKRNAQKAVNDEMKRQMDLEGKMQDLAAQAVEAKMSGNYIQAAILEQQARNAQFEFNQETQDMKQVAIIDAKKARAEAIKGGASITKSESAQIVKKANGGLIKGPGTGRSDSIRATLGYAGGGSIRVSNGEFVIKESSVKDYGVAAMNAVNNGTATISTGASRPVVNNNNIYIEGSDLSKKEIAQAVMVELSKVQSKNNKTNMVAM